MKQYRTLLNAITGLTTIVCNECGARTNCGLYLVHLTRCSEWTKTPRALRVGQSTHVIHCTYPTIEDARNASPE